MMMLLPPMHRRRTRCGGVWLECDAVSEVLFSFLRVSVERGVRLAIDLHGSFSLKEESLNPCLDCRGFISLY